jgi:hypothetical protein
VEVPTLAADRYVEGAVRPAPLDHQPLRDRPSHGPSQVPLAEAGKALGELPAPAEAVVSEVDDRSHYLLGRGQFATGRHGGTLGG